jgi:8-oxo-dGTP pyrophosphatase MutT (NUDIX family)
MIDQSAETADYTAAQLATLGPRRFGSERWKSMAMHLSAELQSQGFTSLPPKLLARLTWIACVEAYGPETAHNVDKHCSRKVAGVIIWHGNDLALQERLTGAKGIAPSAGHLEETEDPEEAVRREASEETGLTLLHCALMATGRRFDKCKRFGSDYHDWFVFEGHARNREDLRLNPDESVSIAWYQPFQVLELASRTEEFLQQRVSQADWEQRPGLEVVWYWWFQHLGVLDRLKLLAS